MSLLLIIDADQLGRWALDAETARHVAVALREHRARAARNGIETPTALAEIEAVCAGLSRVAGQIRTNPDNRAEPAASSEAMTDPLLTESQAALQLGVSDRTVRRYRAAGDLEAIKVGGRTYITESSIEAMRRA